MGLTVVRAAVPLRKLEGRRVRVYLANGAQFDAELISAGRGGVPSLWLDLDGADLFVNKDEILDIHEIFVDPAPAA